MPLLAKVYVPDEHPRIDLAALEGNLSSNLRQVVSVVSIEYGERIPCPLTVFSHVD